MQGFDRLRQTNEELRDRLSRLSQASLLITQSLDLNTILQNVVDGACLIADARYGALLVFDDGGDIENLAISGMAPEDVDRVGSQPTGDGLLGYLNEIQGPLRLTSVADHPRAVGVPENHPPVTTFLGTTISHLGRSVGSLYLCDKRGGEFTSDDEETLVMFASQAALAISNALNYQSEQQARANLEVLVETSPMGVAVFDARTRVLTSINQEAKRIIGSPYVQGRTLDESRSMMSFRRMDGSEIPHEELPLSRVLEHDETVRAEELVVHHPDGQVITILVNASSIRSENGEVISAIVTMQDIKPLEDLERLRAEFLGIVSHELRSPLTTIKGSAATAIGSAFPLNDVETRQFFRIIDEQADHMRNLINNLLDMTHIEAGMLSVNTEPTEVSYLIDQARSAFLGAGARNVITVDLAPGLPPVRADRQRALQALNNLLSNAARRSPDWSAITVSASQDDVYVRVSITDQGRVLTPDELDRLFRKFSRIDDPEGLRNPVSEGLSLAICKGIVESHGGRIWAENAGPGHGARLNVTLPIAEDVGIGVGPVPLAVNRERTRINAFATSEQTRILAIDDDPQTLWYLRNTLNDAGYATIVASNPREMENLLASEQPHLVLLDLVLPGTDGFELLKRVSSIADVPVIFLSGNGMDENITRALEMGADDYIVKPFSPTELVARIRASLRKRALSDEGGPLQPYTSGDLTIDYAERSVTLAGRPVHVTTTEYRLLSELSVGAGRVLTHDQLLERVWGPEYSGDLQLLRAFVKSLRNKLGDNARNPSYIFTEPRVGYRMASPKTPAGEP